MFFCKYINPVGLLEYFKNFHTNPSAYLGTQESLRISQKYCQKPSSDFHVG